MNITVNSLHTNHNFSFKPAFGGKKGIIITKEQVLNLRNSGFAEKKIAEELGVSLAYYYKQLKKLGLPSKLSNYNDELNKISKEKFEELLKQHFSILDICKYFKITTTAYYNLIKKFDLKNYMHGANSKVITKNMLQELVDNKLPPEEICKRLNISQSVYYKLLQKLDIQTEYKKSKERVAKVKKEDIINLIESGKTYPEIAEILGIAQPTLQRLITKLKISTKILQKKEAINNVTKEKLEELIESGKNVDEICKELNISRRNYSTLVNRFGIMTAFRQNKANTLSITKKELQTLVDKGLTVKEICKTLNISNPLFYHLLKRLGVNYNYKHHARLKEVPKNKLEETVKNWESQAKAEEELDVAATTFHHKAREAKVTTVLSGSIDRLKELEAKTDEIQMYLDEGATPQEICEMYDIPPVMYHSLIRKYNLVSTAKRKFDSAKNITKEQLEQLLRSGKSKMEICEELGISRNTLALKLAKFGIKTKNLKN